MTAYTIVEPCCGSAALTLHLLGAKHAVLPYQGSKWRYRKQLEEVLRSFGFTGKPSRAVLTDSGPWGTVMGVLLDDRGLENVLFKLDMLRAYRDPREVFDALQGRPVPLGSIDFTAEFLFLQRLAFSCKAVGVVKGCWLSPGFNKTSAYGVASTGRFGKVNPMLPSLLKTLRSYRGINVEAIACQGSALRIETRGPTIEYIDPPYVGSTPYPNGDLNREGVVALALDAEARGRAVIVSEAEPIAELAARPGWRTACLEMSGTFGESPFKRKKAEWITFRGPPR